MLRYLWNTVSNELIMFYYLPACVRVIDLRVCVNGRGQLRVECEGE